MYIYSASYAGPYGPKDLPKAVDEFTQELKAFCFDGLRALYAALDKNEVPRGSWASCPISYREGSAGSARRDSQGRARNIFTVLWDNGWITAEEAQKLVGAEITARSVSYSNS